MCRNLTTSIIVLVVAVFSLSGVFPSSAQDKASTVWPHGKLKTHIVEKNEACGPQPARKVTIDPKIGKLMNRQLATDAPWPIIRVVQTKIDRTSKDTYFIDYDPGPSCDPGFFIVPSGQKRPIGSIGTDHIIIPGNGFIYSIGRSNQHFSVHRKFVLKKGKIVEIPQPFHFVGMETKAKQKIVLRSRKEGGHLVATIPKDGKLTVLINEGDHYLVKTPFGLIGWIKIEPGSQTAVSVEGIFFLGD